MNQVVLFDRAQVCKRRRFAADFYGGFLHPAVKKYQNLNDPA